MRISEGLDSCQFMRCPGTSGEVSVRTLRMVLHLDGYLPIEGLLNCSAYKKDQNSQASNYIPPHHQDGSRHLQHRSTSKKLVPHVCGGWMACNYGSASMITSMCFHSLKTRRDTSLSFDRPAHEEWPAQKVSALDAWQERRAQLASPSG